MGRLPLMRSIIMNVILNVDYTRYVLSVEDAAKVMKILSGSTVVRAVYGTEEDPEDHYAAQRPAHMTIETLDKPVRN